MTCATRYMVFTVRYTVQQNLKHIQTMNRGDRDIEVDYQWLEITSCKGSGMVRATITGLDPTRNAVSRF